ncbi:FkbM family methyltransferase [Patescibacteria group bacterium]|nr:FkbM family methyltransferase [Patescibacteria group bacterium]
MKRYFEIKKLIENYGINKILKAGVKEIHRKVWLEFINNSYSQCGEDVIIEKLFKENYVGRFLEIGAYHPKRLSNTYRLYKKGWRGIVVEPNPAVKELFMKFRPQDVFLNLGVSNKNQFLNYYQFIIPALNTFSRKESENSVNAGHKLEKVTKIKTIKIDEIIDKKIDFLSIDTEGFDEMILMSWPWKKYKPEVICIETDKGNSNIEKLLWGKNYERKFENKFNSIFVLKKSKLWDGRKP